MQRDPRVYLWDVQQAATDIEVFLAGVDFEAYKHGKLVRAAVERKFEVIGEALNQLLKHAPELAGRISDVRRIIDFRNHLIHGYGRVDQAEVWRIAKASLPALKAEVSALLAELGPPEE
jgi:uncharacterized protein with HEPN domain